MNVVIPTEVIKANCLWIPVHYGLLVTEYYVDVVIQEVQLLVVKWGMWNVGLGIRIRK